MARHKLSITSLGALIVVSLVATACSRGEEDRATPSASPSPTPSPSTSPSPEAIPPVAARAVFKARGYRFLRTTGGVRKKAQRAFPQVIGPDLFEVATRRAQRESDVKARVRALAKWRKERRRSPKRNPRPPAPVPEALVLVLSVKANEDSVDELQMAMLDALSPKGTPKEVRLAGHDAYFDKDATPRHQSSVFFFYERTAVVQIFGRGGLVKELGARILRARAS